MFQAVVKHKLSRCIVVAAAESPDWRNAQLFNSVPSIHCLQQNEGCIRPWQPICAVAPAGKTPNYTQTTYHERQRTKMRHNKAGAQEVCMQNVCAKHERLCNQLVTCNGLTLTVVHPSKPLLPGIKLTVALSKGFHGELGGGHQG